MLQPGDIRRYKAPDYHDEPPSHAKPEPQRLPFKCIVVDSVDASLGGLPPSMLFRLRKLGCNLVLARCTASPSAVVEDACHTDQERRLDPMLGNRAVTFEEMCLKHVDKHLTPELLDAHWKNLALESGKASNKLHDEWFDAVFDRVIDISETDASSSSQTGIERYLEDEDISPEEVVCFASTICGAHVFAAMDSGFIISPAHSLVMAGADVAISESPSVRQLAWLHQMYMEKRWCTCIWAIPAENEFGGSTRCDGPSMEERAELSAIASPTLTALGHPPWVIQGSSCCTVRSGGHTIPCPDWTPMEPLFKYPDKEVGIRDIEKVRLYSHSLDVGIGQVNHALEMETKDGLYFRVSSNRFVNKDKGREYGAAAELCVTLNEYDYVRKQPPQLRIRSKLSGYALEGKAFADYADKYWEKEYRMVRCVRAGGRPIAVTVWHRLYKDQGKGEVQIDLAPGNVNREAFMEAHGTDGVEIIVYKPLRGTRYIIHKIVSILVFDAGPTSGPSTSTEPPQWQKRWKPPMLQSPPKFSDLKGEHRAEWRKDWDKADIVIDGARQAALCQRAARLFRFHQVSRFNPDLEDDVPSSVPQVLMESLKGLFEVFFADQLKETELTTPSVLLTSLLQKQPEAPEGEAIFKIWPRMPPTCSLLQFNVAIGQSWYRLTFTAGVVKILRQGPALERLAQGLVMDTDEHQLIKFLIPIAGDKEGVIIQPSAWQEVNVDYALTELGNPDGGAGGFYGVMRQSRLVRADLVWRFWQEGRQGFQKFDSALVSILQVAEKRLQSIPRPSKWKSGPHGDKFVHSLIVDSSLLVRVNLMYEKRELDRDIQFVTNGEESLKRKMQRQHDNMFQDAAGNPITWIDNHPMPSWSDLEQQAIKTLETAARTHPQEELAFGNFITDRDGTTNNYCDRYASSVQSAYNAILLMRFAHHCARKSMYITAAPLGGRPYSEGLMELSVMRHGAVTYAGSKGREYYDDDAQKVCELEPLDSADQELMDDLYRRLVVLCAKPENTKFLGIGSGLQQKYGEITLARNDPNRTIPEPESKRFMADVRSVKLDLDPEGSLLDLHDTGTDMELFPRDQDGTRAVFDKGQGVKGLDKKLELNVLEGPNLVCGDTDSDVKMITAALELMDPPPESDQPSGTPASVSERSSPFNFIPISRQASATNSLCNADSPRNHTEVEVPRRALAVLFVISPEQHKKSKNLANDIRQLCRDNGAFCTILPSPDLLVWSLAGYARTVVMSAFEKHHGDVDALAESCKCSAVKLRAAMDANQEEWLNKLPEKFAEEVFEGNFYE